MRFSQTRQMLIAVTFAYTIPTAARAQSYSETVLADKPVAYYRLGETTGSVAHDLTSNHIDGTVLGGTSLGVPGAIVGDSDTSMRFDGSSGSVDVSGIPGVGSGGFTVEAWFNQNHRDGDQWYYTQAVVCRGSDRDPGNWWLNYHGSGAYDFMMNFGGSFNFGEGVGAPADRYALHEWHHMVGTFDPAGATMRLFMDGAMVSELTKQGATFPVVQLPTSIAYMPSGYYRFDGSIDEVAVYDHALSADRILTHYLKGGGRHVPGISIFAFTPNPVNAPGDQVTADVFSDEPLTSVTIAGNPLQFHGVAPTKTLTLNEGHWTATFPTSFLSNAITEAVSFDATGKRPDGSTVSATATLNVKTTLNPALVAVSTTLRTVNPGNSFKVAAHLMSTAAPSTNPAMLTLNIPPSVDVQGTTGGTWDAAGHTLTWTGPVWGRMDSTVTATVRVPETTPDGSTLSFSSRGIVPGKADASGSTTVTVMSGTIPRSVEVDASQGKNMLTGHTSVESGQNPPPLIASISPWTEAHFPFLGQRRLKLWLEVTNIQRDGLATLSIPSDGGVPSALADRNLIAPDVSPTWLAAFPNVDSSVTLQANFTPTAAEIQILENLLKLFGTPSINDIVSDLDEWSKINAVTRAVAHFSPFPRNAFQLGKAMVAAGNEFFPPTDLMKDQVYALVKRHYPNSPETADSVCKKLKGLFATWDFVGEFNDLVLFNCNTVTNEWGSPLQVRFNASPQPSG